MERFDTIVIGAGVAGVAAAVASARHGARTMLVESGVCAGGMGSAGLVPCFTPFSYKERPLVAGIAGEVHRRLCQYGGSIPGPWAMIDAEWMKYVCDEILEESKVEIRYLTTFCGAETEGHLLKSIRLLDRSGEYQVAGENFIDCTGDAALAHAVGVATRNGDESGRTQPGSCCFVISGVKPEKILTQVKEASGNNGVIRLTNLLRERLREWLDAGYLSNREDFEFHVAGANLDIAHGVARVNFGHFYGLGSCDSAAVSRMLVAGRRRIREFVECLRGHLPGMEDAVLVGTPSLPDIRESRRIVGRRELTGCAFWNGETHEDDIALYDYCVDVHALSLAEAQTGLPPDFIRKMTETKLAKRYGIPLGICLTREYDNLAVAGRCVSATQEMLGALRVMPAAMSTGQAVGTAAALSKPLSAVNLQELRETLRRDGVILEA